jgi:hypothetical protein
MSIKLGANVVPQFKLGIINLNKIMLGAIEIFPNLAPSGGFDPSDFFTGLDDGVFYNYSDITSIFQDPAGTVPITAGGQTIGLVNDLKGVGTPINIPQNTAAARPLADSRYNKMVATENFSDPVYRLNNVVPTPNSGLAPDGTNTSNIMQCTGAGQASLDQFSTNHGLDDQVNQTFSTFFKPGTLTTISVGFAQALSRLDIATGVITNAASVVASGVVDVGGGWFRFWQTCPRLNVFIWHSVVLDELIPTSTATCELWGWQLENPTSVPVPQPYQWVNTPTDYNWQIAALGARFDTIDDVMTSAAFSLAGEIRTMCLAVEWIAPQSGVAAFANHGYTAFGPGMGITGQNQNAYNVEGTSGGNRATSPPNYPPTNRASVIAINEPLVPYIEIQVNGLKTSNNNVQGGPFVQNVPFSIGRGQGFNDPANCRIIAVLLINRALTLTEQQQWNDWAYNLLDITP